LTAFIIRLAFGPIKLPRRCAIARCPETGLQENEVKPVGELGCTLPRMYEEGPEITEL